MIRTHHTNKKVIDLNKIYKPKFDDPTCKPAGLWYDIDGSWREWCDSEMPDWTHKYSFELEIDITDMLIIDTEEKFMNFFNKYGEIPVRYGLTDDRHKMIKWNIVKDQYSGIEISPYQYKFRLEYMWYYGWDIASGCIWNLSAIKNYNLVAFIKTT